MTTQQPTAMPRRQGRPVAVSALGRGGAPTWRSVGMSGGEQCWRPDGRAEWWCQQPALWLSRCGRVVTPLDGGAGW
jgi:hypothetical protein